MRPLQANGSHQHSSARVRTAILTCLCRWYRVVGDILESQQAGACWYKRARLWDKWLSVAHVLLVSTSTVIVVYMDVGSMTSDNTVTAYGVEAGHSY